MQQKTLNLVNEIKVVLGSYNVRITVRQLYYQLVAKQIIKNNLNSYKRLDSILSDARKNGSLNFDAFVDRMRKPIKESSWPDLKGFISTVKNSYSKDKWQNQEKYVEVWLEKDALAGIFEPITAKYDLNLSIGRGYQSLSSLNDAARRFPKDKEVHVLYFGDFDSTGLDIPRSAEKNLNDHFGLYPTFERLALTKNDIDQYKLPPAPAKTTDSRTHAFVKQHGDIAVELDALPPDVLIERIEGNIIKYLDIGQFQKDLHTEKEEIKKLNKLQIKL